MGASSLRPFVLKAAFYLPTRQGRVRAVAHLKYMGHPDKEDLVSAHESDHAMGLESAAVHAKYMSERPGSCGYFGPAPDHAPDPDAVAKALRRHAGPIWRHFVSVTEADARALGGGLLDRPAWEAAARQVVPQMSEAMGIPVDRVRWVAALHRKEGHPHLHLLMWEDPPGRERGQLSQHELRSFKRAWVSALYRPELERIGTEKSAVRQELLTAARVRLSRREERDLAERLTALTEHLPGHGRISYKLAPASLKDELSRAADWLLQASPALTALAERYGDLAEQLARHYSDQPAQHQAARDKATSDLRDRVANAVLRAAVQLDRQTVRAEWAAQKHQDPQFRQDVEAATRALMHGPREPTRADRLATQILAARDARVSGSAPDGARQARERAWLADQLLREAHYRTDQARFQAAGLVAALGRGLERELQRAEREAEAAALEAEAQRLREATR